MSALARYFIASDCDVAGYDRRPTALTDKLAGEGCLIHFEAGINNIPEAFASIHNKNSTLVIYTPAVKTDNIEYRFFESNAFNILKRSQVLGLISEKMSAIAVAGTHGKTTVSSMLAHILSQSEAGCTAFLGGILKNYDSNVLLGEGDLAVVEADEFDRSFLHLKPSTAVITSIDPDHLDIYKSRSNIVESFILFIERIRKGGKLLIKKGVERDIQTAHLKDLDVYSYALDSEADFYARNIKLSGSFYDFDVHTPGKVIEGMRLAMPGMINIENAIAAAGMAWLHDIPAGIIRKALLSFSGIKRRFDIRYKGSAYVYIDDYAHHPVEVKSFIQSVRKLYPGKRILGIFQPHLFSRTRDLYAGFAESLQILDELILLDIYPAREREIEGVSSELILEKADIKEKQILSKEELAAYIRNSEFDVILTMGAGDIDTLAEAIIKILEEKER